MGGPGSALAPPVPVLAGVLLEATDEGTLKLSTFDYEVSARAELPADVRTAGRVLVSGRLLADISRSLPARPVTLTTEGSKVVVTCGASRFTLLTMSVDEYPSLPQLPEASGRSPAVSSPRPSPRSPSPRAATRRCRS